jgi:hypothetical protein
MGINLIAENKSENARFIEMITEKTRQLLEDDWPDLETMRGNEQKIRISLVHTLSWEGNERRVKSAVSFGRRFKHSIEDTFQINQLEMPELAGDGFGKKKKI